MMSTWCFFEHISRFCSSEGREKRSHTVALCTIFYFWFAKHLTKITLHKHEFIIEKDFGKKRQKDKLPLEFKWLFLITEVMLTYTGRWWQIDSCLTNIISAFVGLGILLVFIESGMIWVHISGWGFKAQFKFNKRSIHGWGSMKWETDLILRQPFPPGQRCWMSGASYILIPSPAIKGSLLMAPSSG